VLAKKKVIYSTERVKLTQVKLNNIFRVSANSTKGKSFDPQPIVDHYVNLSIKANQKGTKVVLQDGQEVPNVFNLKQDYIRNRASTKPHSKPTPIPTSQVTNSMPPTPASPYENMPVSNTLEPVIKYINNLQAYTQQIF